jgi:hypothetical protein
MLSGNSFVKVLTTLFVADRFIMLILRTCVAKNNQRKGKVPTLNFKGNV